MRAAAIDLGTNSTRLLVADVEDGRLEEVARRTEITRLGEGVDERGKLLPLPIARVRNVLSDYRRELERLGAERVLAIATSAVRDAENGEAFLGEVEWSYGFTTRLVSGEEEAELTRRGVATGRPLGAGTLVLDVGGGSTELITAAQRTSLDVGSRAPDRATPALGPADARRAGGRRARGARAAAAARADGGDRRRRHGHDPRSARRWRSTTRARPRLPISREAVERQLERLASLPLAERRELPGLEPKRAPVILGGVLIVREVLDRYGLDGLEVSERDLLDGAALEAAELPEPVEGDAPPGAYTCC